MIWTLIAQNWRKILVVAMIAFMLGQCAYIKHDNKEIRDLNVEVAALHEANEEMADAAAKQNKAVQQLKADGEARQAEASKAIAAAKKTALAHQKEATAIMLAHPAGDDCAAANILLTDYMKGGTP